MEGAGRGRGVGKGGMGGRGMCKGDIGGRWRDGRGVAEGLLRMVVGT